MGIVINNEFYFLRHGQTDHNLHALKEDHPSHISLNETGRSQAIAVEPIIASLPVKTICYSPMLRAVETKEIVAARLSIPQMPIPDLTECNALVWEEMHALQTQAFSSAKEPLLGFLQRVSQGVNQALSCKGPVLIIAHGGIHWAICSVLNVQSQDWKIDNCVPVRFFLDGQGLWRAEKLN